MFGGRDGVDRAAECGGVSPIVRTIAGLDRGEPAHFHGISGFDPNSYGRSRSRLANLFFTIFSRIEGHPAPQVWPIANPPGICPGNIDIDPDGY
jgi:hypothetical protein